MPDCHLPQPVHGCPVQDWVCPCPPPSAGALLGTAHTCSVAGGGGREAPPSPPPGKARLLCPLVAAQAAFGLAGLWTTPARCPMAPALPCRTPTWSTSWPLPTSLPKHTRCLRAMTWQLCRPSSAPWSCHPSRPRRGSRSPSQRSRRRRRCLRVRLPMPLDPPGYVPRSCLVGLCCSSSLPQHPEGPKPRQEGTVLCPPQCHGAQVPP